MASFAEMACRYIGLLYSPRIIVFSFALDAISFFPPIFQVPLCRYYLCKFSHPQNPLCDLVAFHSLALLLLFLYLLSRCIFYL